MCSVPWGQFKCHMRTVRWGLCRGHCLRRSGKCYSASKESSWRANSKTAVRNGQRAPDEEFIGSKNVIAFVTLGWDCWDKIMSEYWSRKIKAVCSFWRALCLPWPGDVKKRERGRKYRKSEICFVLQFAEGCSHIWSSELTCGGRSDAPPVIQRLHSSQASW